MYEIREFQKIKCENIFLFKIIKRAQIEKL